MAKMKTVGSPKQPDQSPNNDTTERVPVPMCPLLTMVCHTSAHCTKNCAWYAETTYKQGCALKVIGEALVDVSTTLGTMYDFGLLIRGGGRL